MRERRGPQRFASALALVGAAFVVIALRLLQLAWLEGDRLAGLARRQRETRLEIEPLRGTIVDRSGDVLAVSVRGASVYVRPRRVPPQFDPGPLLRRLAIPHEEWLRKVSSEAPFVWLRRQANPDEVEAIEALAPHAVGILPERRRLYPRGALASAVIGFAGIDSQGLEGVERAYDGFLRGRPGTFGVERDALGRKIFSGAHDGEARRGADVVLTLDSTLQYAAERELERQVEATGAQGGIAVALDPRTGEVLAMAQTPSFDPNEVASSRPEERRNRVITDVYEPGSTLKGLLAAAVLEEGAASRQERFFCEEGDYRIGKAVIHDHHGHGWLTFDRIFWVSSNICAAKLAARIGAERYGAYLQAFGLGRRTGIDLLGEQPGLLRPPGTWKPLELATIAFGQGIAITPLQLAAAYAALANGGVLMRPYVVRRVVAADGTVLLENSPQPIRRVVREETARAVTEILEGVVGPEGTGERASIPGVRVAGKTGTSQKANPGRRGYSRGRIASFVGYFPAENPRMVLLVLVDEPRTTIWGGTAAAPLFREIALAAIERLGIERDIPVEGPAGAEPLPARLSLGSGEPAGADRLPSFLGLSLREALARTRELGLSVEVRGSGYVVQQQPPPGAPRLEPGESLRLELQPGEEESS
jgi:cell division protein FtsI (penicillin-binding protein 3)